MEEKYVESKAGLTTDWSSRHWLWEWGKYNALGRPYTRIHPVRIFGAYRMAVAVCPVGTAERSQYICIYRRLVASDSLAKEWMT